LGCRSNGQGLRGARGTTRSGLSRESQTGADRARIKVATQIDNPSISLPAELSWDLEPGPKSRVAVTARPSAVVDRQRQIDAHLLSLWHPKGIIHLSALPAADRLPNLPIPISGFRDFIPTGYSRRQPYFWTRNLETGDPNECSGLASPPAES